MKAEIILNHDYIIGEPDGMLFGSFVEHIGRSVYTGIYEPDHYSADEYGFRGDVGSAFPESGIPAEILFRGTIGKTVSVPA